MEKMNTKIKKERTINKIIHENPVKKIRSKIFQLTDTIKISELDGKKEINDLEDRYQMKKRRRLK